MVSEESNKAESRVLAFGALWALLGLGLGYISQYLFSLSISRSLSLEQAGNVFQLISYITISAIVGRFGMDRLVLREVAGSGSLSENRSFSRQLCGVWLFLVMLLSIGIFLLEYSTYDIASKWLGINSDQHAYTVWAATVPWLALSYVIAQGMRGQRRTGSAAWIQLVIIFGVSACILPIAVDNWGKSETTAGWVFLVASLIATIIGVWVFRSGWMYPRSLSVSIAALCEMRNSAHWLFLISILTFAFQGLDIMLVAALAGAEQAALYAVAQKTSLFVSLGLVGVNAILASSLAKHHIQGDSLGLKHAMETAARWSFCFGVIVACVLLVVGEVLLGLFGIEYAKSYPLLLVLMLGQLVNAATGGVSVLLQMTGNEKITAKIMTVFAVISLPCYVLAIEYFGVWGAGLVASLVLAGWNLMLARTASNLFSARIVARTIIPGIALIVFCGFVAVYWPLSQSLWVLQVPLLGLIFSGWGWFWLLSNDDRDSLTRQGKKFFGAR